MVDLKTYVGIQVRAQRLKMGLTQEQLAESVDKAVETISNIERGHSATSMNTLEKLANALELPLVSFFEGRKERDRRTAQRIELESELSATMGNLDDRQLEFLLDTAGNLQKRLG